MRFALRARTVLLAIGGPLRLSHTPAMRQWACVVALLLGLAGNNYAWTARSRMPIPIERRLDSMADRGRLVRTLDWWRA